MYILKHENLIHLFSALQKHSYTIIGPTVRDGTIVYDHLTLPDELPKSWTDEQLPSSYRLHETNSGAYFEFVVGPHTWKRYLYPVRSKVFSASRTGVTFAIQDQKEDEKKFAFLGVRACELQALDIHDKVFGGGEYIDPTYTQARTHAFVIAVNCTRSGGNCFCASMECGPRAQSGFDLAMTEMISDDGRYFTVEVGSRRGEELFGGVPHFPAEDKHATSVNEVMRACVEQMEKKLDTTGITQLLHDNFDNPEWDAVAKRCLTCANCTMVCPTCFCSTVEDVTDLTGHHAERWRRWDSCFTVGFAKVAGGNFRPSARARYRQWLTHKLGTWNEQFGTSGCVGCGRCITWCPVGIDITEEVQKIRNSNLRLQQQEIEHAT